MKTDVDDRESVRQQGCVIRAQGADGGADGEVGGIVEAADVGAEVSDLAGGIV